MKIIKTHELTPTSLRSQAERDWVYNGLDCCVTAEVLSTLLPQLDNLSASTYAFSRALQGPVLEMRLRGVRIDTARKSEVVDTYFYTLDKLERNLERIVLDGIGLPHFNWQSTKDLRELFYDYLGIPPIRKAGRPTVNRDALEKIEVYTYARQLVAHIKSMRDIGKKIGMLKTEIDPDGRIRTSYNIAGTTTGRFSSSFSEFGTGTNLQNIEELLRSIFIADKGQKLAYIDAEQGESRVVGAIEWNLFKDGRYLDACESGDLHTSVSKMCEPGLAWTGNLQRDREIAERPYYRHYDLRKLCKSIGHGTNYGGMPPTLNRLYKIPIPLITDFQSKYFTAFPAHRQWHEVVEETLWRDGHLVSLTGRRRWFFGRRNDQEVIREAIAFDPQCSLGDILNQGMLQVWRERDAIVLMQIHDAIIIQYPEKREDEIIPKILKQITYPIELSHGRTLTIPYGCQTGWNWGKASKDNPDGLKAYEPSDKRKRQAEVALMDRVIRRTHV